MLDITISCKVLVVIMRVSVLDQTDHVTASRCNYCKAPITKLQSSTGVHLSRGSVWLSWQTPLYRR